MHIQGKRAVIVGGASGFGYAAAEALAERGAAVAVLDLPTSAGRQVADALGGAFYKVDVTDFAGTEQALDQAVQQLGGLHVVVTTAGGGGPVQRTFDQSGPHDLGAFRAILDLNVVATFNVNRLAASHMSRNESEDGERGVIVNTSSLAAFGGQPGLVAYTAAKAAIAGMCLTMARDLGDLGIRVMAIAPSLFATGMTAGVSGDVAAALTRDAPFPRRLGRPGEYAQLVVAIVENQMLNGQCLRLDAGLRR
ncbi:MAG: SDR family NAD(P)-dependent oxidoreductase [Mycobacterium sp.]